MHIGPQLAEAEKLEALALRFCPWMIEAEFEGLTQEISWLSSGAKHRPILRLRRRLAKVYLLV